MLRVAVTGGIGSGKSTASARLAELGAVVVDSDKLARDVVAVGTPGLAAIEQRFTAAVIGPDGTLDRAALAAIVFSEPAARRDLEGIIHPLVRQEFVALAAAADPAAIVVNDIPLLTQLSVVAQFHLVIGVGADDELRVQRLIGRGLAESDARARLAAQIDDAARRPLTDAWLDNNGSPGDLRAQIDTLWTERLQPFNANLLARRRATKAKPVIEDPDPRWPTDAQRLLARAVAAADGAAVSAEHIGSTAVPGLPAKDVIDLQLGVASLEVADEISDALTRSGFVAVDGQWLDTPHPADSHTAWPQRFHANADPGRPAHLHVRVVGGPGWSFALQCRDWLRADDAARDGYARHKASTAAESGETAAAYTAAKEPWFEGAWERSSQWAAATGWQPPVPG